MSSAHVATDCMSLPAQAVLECRLLVIQHSLLTDLGTPRDHPPASKQRLTV